MPGSIVHAYSNKLNGMSHIGRYSGFIRNTQSVEIVPNSDGSIFNCSCGRVAERNGKCATCNFEMRKSLRSAERKASKKSVRIRPRSKKRAVEDAEYSRERTSWLPGKKCAVYPHLDATEIHHMKGRRGYANAEKRQLGITLLLDKDFWLPVSNKGHGKITHNSKWAFRMGYSLIRSNTGTNNLQ